MKTCTVADEVISDKGRKRNANRRRGSKSTTSNASRALLEPSHVRRGPQEPTTATATDGVSVEAGSSENIPEATSSSGLAVNGTSNSQGPQNGVSAPADSPLLPFIEDVDPTLPVLTRTVCAWKD